MVDQKNILQSMGAHEISNHFRPVNCKEKDIKSKAAVAGFLYFTQDTHKIYQGLPTGEYQMVGGSSSIFYGTRNLTDDEKDIVRRGRNTENHHVAKNANVADYSQSTGFEALIGYLYLTKQDERLEEILNMCIE